MYSNNSFSIDKKFWIILLIPVIYFVVFFLNGNPLVPDGVQYSDLGRSLFSSGVYNSSFGVVPGWVQPPLFPVLIGVFSLILPLEVAGHIVGIICAVLILFVLFRFTKSVFGMQIAHLAVLLLAINPLFLLGNIGVISESVYTVINLILFVFIYGRIYVQEGFDYKSVVIIGFLFAGLYSTRPEAILYLPLLFYVLIKHSNFKKVLLFLAMVIVIFSIYGLYSIQKMDEFKISPKLTYSSRIGLFVAQYYSANQNQPDIDHKNAFSWYGYDSTANAIYGENIMNKVYFENLQKKYQAEISLSDAALALIKRVVFNLYQVLKVMIISSFMPISFLLIVLLGVWSFYQEDKHFIFIVVMWLLPMLYFLISHVEIRFFYVMLPLLSIFGAVGLISILNKSKFTNKILLIIFTVFILNNYTHYSEFYENRKHNLKYKAISNELEQLDFKIDKICSKNFYVSFFGGYDFIKLPICNPDQLYQYMMANNSDLLILDSEVQTSHLALLKIYNNETEKFNLIDVFNFDDEIVKMYQLKKIYENSDSKE